MFRYRALGWLSVAVSWEVLSRVYRSPVFPPLTAILASWLHLLTTGELSGHIASSFQHVGLGLLAAFVIGSSLAVLMYLSPAFALLIDTLLDSLRPISALALYPLFILLFGIGLGTKIVVVFWTAWPAVLLTTLHALRATDPDVVAAAQVDGASRSKILSHIRVPLALPMIVTGWKIAVSGGWISLIAAEMIGSQSGLGYAVLAYSQTFHFAPMWAVIFTIALSGLAFNSFFNFLSTLPPFADQSPEDLSHVQSRSARSVRLSLADRAHPAGRDGRL